MEAYRILGVSKNASEEEIKKAFRIKSKQYHPDNPSVKDEGEHFKKVANAYEELNSTKKRTTYCSYQAAKEQTRKTKTRKSKSSDYVDYAQETRNRFKIAKHYMRKAGYNAAGKEQFEFFRAVDKQYRTIIKEDSGQFRESGIIDLELTAVGKVKIEEFTTKYNKFYSYNRVKKMSKMQKYKFQSDPGIHIDLIKVVFSQLNSMKPSERFYQRSLEEFKKIIRGHGVGFLQAPYYIALAMENWNFDITETLLPTINNYNMTLENVVYLLGCLDESSFGEEEKQMVMSRILHCFKHGILSTEESKISLYNYLTKRYGFNSLYGLESIFTDVELENMSLDYESKIKRR